MAHVVGSTKKNVCNVLAQNARVDLLIRGGKVTGAMRPRHVGVAVGLGWAQEGELLHQGNVVSEAGQFGTVAPVLAVMKQRFMERKALYGTAPHRRVPEMGTAWILTGDQLARADAAGEESACNGIDSVGFVNTQLEITRQIREPIGAGIAPDGWRQGLASPENCAGPAGSDFFLTLKHRQVQCLAWHIQVVTCYSAALLSSAERKRNSYRSSASSHWRN